MAPTLTFEMDVSVGPSTFATLAVRPFRAGSLSYLKTVAFVQFPVPRSAGLEIGRNALGVATLNDRVHQDRAHAVTLALRVDADEGQVKVRLGGMVPLDRIDRPQEARQVATEDAQHRREQRQLLADRQLPGAGRLPDADAGRILDRVGLLVAEPYAPQVELEAAPGDRHPAGVIRQKPGEERVVVEGPCQGPGEVTGPPAPGMLASHAPHHCEAP